MAGVNLVDGGGELGEPGLSPRYRVGDPLGGGAQSRTFRVVDQHDGVERVLKLFGPGSDGQGTALAEFRSLESLVHPSVVRVRDIGRTADGRLFIVTDLVRGSGLDQVAAIGDAAERRGLFTRAAADLASGLAHLHGRGVIHGDVTPGNVRLAQVGDGPARAILIDFGLAGPPRAGGGGARGTLGYSAPEALTGARTVATDLFGVGATLFEAWAGTPPFGRGLLAAQRMLSGPAPLLSTIRPGLGEGWDRLLGRLLAAEPSERPASARLLLREIARLADDGRALDADLEVPQPDGDPLAGLFVGRRAERDALRRALESLSDPPPASPVVVLAGAPGSGRRTLFEAAARDVAVAAAAAGTVAPEIWRGDLTRLQGWLAVPDGQTEEDPRRALEGRLARIARAIEARAAQRPLCVYLDEGEEAAALARFMGGAPGSAAALVVIAARGPLDAPFAATIELPPFARHEVLALLAPPLESEPPPAAVEAIARAAGGNATIAATLVRRFIDNTRAGRPVTVSLQAGDDLDALLAAGWAALSPAARRLVVAAAFGVAGFADEGASEARRAGWLDVGGDGRLALPGAAHRRAILGAPADAETRAVAARLLAGGDLPAERRVDALVLAGRPADAAGELRSQAGQAAAAGDTTRAAGLLAQAEALAPVVLSFDERIAQATGLGALGRYDGAAEALAAARASAATDVEVATALERTAWLLARRGELEKARATLEECLPRFPVEHEPGRTLRARLGRLLVTAGRYREAVAAVAPLAQGLVGAADPAAAVAIETALLACAYQGDLAGARRWLGALPARLGETRRAYLSGLLAQLGGDSPGARDAYRRAYELAAGADDIHTLAAVALNLGGLLIDEGLYGEALTAAARAVRELGRLGASAELLPALVNSANLFVSLGDLPAARRALDRAAPLARASGAAAAAATASFVEGDLARRAGDPEGASTRYAESRAGYYAAGDPASASAAAASQAEVLAARRDLAAARRVLDEARDLRGTAAETDATLARAEGVLALAGALPAGTAAGPASVGALVERLAGLARAAAGQGRRPAAWRLAALAGAVAARAGLPAGDSFELARRLFEEVRMATPEHHRAALAEDPDTAWLSPAAAPGDGVLAARAQAAEARLRRLLRINKRLNSELRLPRLLEMILDTVIELTDAERGFLLLEGDDRELQIKVARNIDQRTLETDELALSRSIARQAATGGEPVVTIDAAGDARFREAMSVSDLHLRSVLAVPLVIKGRPAGTIYVDHRLRKGAFDQEDVRLVLDFAEQAAIALENARLLAELRRRERQVEALNRRLEAELAVRREEISGIQTELRESREALAVRYDYRNIVGRTPRMLDLFRLIDRITDTTLPVVIQGESGTGKELVARALHANGPRRDRAFVGENCAAIPETLLESTLFGYVRGAFTGADHDTRGLFEVADGGTLFLDEVGEMSPAMQGKLLRVLQEGEIRRVGSERTRKVDVRIVAATNRDLARMVEEGKFRRDLFFRLNVAAIALPPLRDRRDDIPLMIDHFLAKIAARVGRPPKPIEPAAMARLLAYRWPGNVRELENEVTRAEALSGERIGAADLSPRVGAAADAGVMPVEDADNVALKPRVERLERALIREALGRAGNNQTKAAEMLGLSRFGLQKKLKRYNFAV
ncbi:MAG TPA: sigma 54-interacting transcriptional regulator [Polyangia bacterium]|nr:sigma 54-interacting transcriptional regulator [Polyangia bacterium]